MRKFAGMLELDEGEQLNVLLTRFNVKAAEELYIKLPSFAEEVFITMLESRLKDLIWVE